MHFGPWTVLACWKNGTQYFKWPFIVLNSYVGTTVCNINRNLDTSNKTRYFFDLKRCSGHSPEYANTLDDALLKEAKSFLQCAKEAIPGIDIKTAKQFSEAVDQCVKVKHGITSQYVYRSMYAPQLYKCSRHIPLEQMLILSSDEMRTNLTSFISKVSSFLLLCIIIATMLMILRCR